MNSIDIKNIKNILKIRNIQFEKGGEYSISHLEKMETNYLKTLLNSYEKSSNQKHIENLHSLVDTAFNFYSTNDKDNMIVFDLCEIYDNSPCSRNPFEIIRFDDRTNFNTIAFPISRFWEYEIEDKHDLKGKQHELDIITEKIKNIIYDKLNVKTVCEYYDHNSSLNDYWYGVYGITKDYTVVTFIMRYDGMADNDSLITVKQC